MQSNNIRNLIAKIKEESSLLNAGDSKLNIMEVCGTHTNVIWKNGINNILKDNIKLISGPGCPVCVTDERYIDVAIELAGAGKTILSFGDMIRVRGTKSSLYEQNEKGIKIHIVYSPDDVLKICQENKKEEYVFLGVGFETTAPIIANLVKNTFEKGIDNLSFLTSIKIMPPIIRYILDNEDDSVNGIICPGHVCSVMGEDYFKFIYERYKIPSVICGFTPESVIAGIYFLVHGNLKMRNKIYDNGYINLYRTCVNNLNMHAYQLINEVFEIKDTAWRGIGVIKESGLFIKEKYSVLDAVKKYRLQLSVKDENLKNAYGIGENSNSNGNVNRCSCGKVIVGKIRPQECSMFGRVCTPQNPIGPCMVSYEGACSAAYKYGGEYNG